MSKSKTQEPSKLTNARIRNAKPGQTLSDAACPGLSLRVSKKGKRVFSWRGRINGKQVRIPIGEWSDVLTLEQARRHARELSAAKDEGRDPHEERREAKLDAQVEEEKRRTLRDVALLYLEERRHEVRHRSWKNIENRLRLHVLPAFGHLRVSEIRKPAVRRWRTRLASEKTRDVSNAALTHLKALVNWAIEMELHDGPNPAHGIPLFPAPGRERFLTNAERACLEAVLTKYENRYKSKVDAIRLLTLTGCRHEEITSLRWEEVHLELELLRLPDERSKTGKKDVPLVPQAVRYLQVLKESRDSLIPWVCPNALGNPEGNYLGTVWRETIRPEAGLEGVRLHDLRHSWASTARAAGIPLEVIQRVLGHKTLKTTMRYVHLGDEVLRDSLKKVGNVLEEALAGEGVADVVVLGRR